jgi:hypothetical protein
LTWKDIKRKQAYSQLMCREELKLEIQRDLVIIEILPFPSVFRKSITLACIMGHKFKYPQLSLKLLWG